MLLRCELLVVLPDELADTFSLDVRPDTIQLVSVTSLPLWPIEGWQTHLPAAATAYQEITYNFANSNLKP